MCDQLSHFIDNSFCPPQLLIFDASGARFHMCIPIDRDGPRGRTRRAAKLLALSIPSPVRAGWAPARERGEGWKEKTFQDGSGTSSSVYILKFANPRVAKTEQLGHSMSLQNHVYLGINIHELSPYGWISRRGFGDSCIQNNRTINGIYCDQRGYLTSTPTGNIYFVSVENVLFF